MYTIGLRSKPRKNGLHSVVLLVYGSHHKFQNKRTQKIITLNVPPCSPDQWNKESRRYRRSFQDYRVYNEALKEIEDRCEQVRTNLASPDHSPTVQEFLEVYRELETPKMDSSSPFIQDLWQEYIDLLKKDKRIKTAQTMKGSLTSWQKFTSKKFKTDIRVEDLKLNHLMEFTYYMQERGNSPNTIGIRMRDLRTVFNSGHKLGKTPMYDEYPFKNYTWVHTRGKVRPHHYLTREEWNSFKTVKIDEPKLEMARDLFVFMVNCYGINFRDLVVLRYDKNVFDREIRFRRTKTRLKVIKPVRVFINDAMRNIMEKYQGNSGFVFDLIGKHHSELEKWESLYKDTLRRFNANLKEVSNIAGIDPDKRITSYVARHTFATLMYYDNVPLKVISQSLGHTTEIETHNYLDDLDATEISNIIKGIL